MVIKSANVGPALAGDARRFKAILNIDSQGEKGLVEADNVDHHFMDTLLTLMARTVSGHVREKLTRFLHKRQKMRRRNAPQTQELNIKKTARTISSFRNRCP
ncbi:catalase HPII [Salmonella enterica subsp. arizonae]|uniref:Catalase HPII n=1 Tax=Salmonella enterica subsp. arizonae TaxID=59203 RepID=A0A379SVN5_SALER|nr:catalase HPII [Salmonella enterica subsp. arizonae]